MITSSVRSGIIELHQLLTVFQSDEVAPNQMPLVQMTALVATFKILASVPPKYWAILNMAVEAVLP